MKPSRLTVISVAAFFALVLAACVPAATPTPAPILTEPPPATAAAPTVEAPTAEAPTAAAPAVAPATGFAVYTPAETKDQEDQLRFYDPNGGLRYALPIGRQEYPGPYLVQVVGDSAYWYDSAQRAILHFGLKLSEKLTGLPAEEKMTSFRVSPDGERVAWTILTTPAPGAFELWVANRDGSDARLAVRQYLSTGAPLALIAVRWTPDGRLIYATQPYGIGGYILYDGYNRLGLYDPASGEAQALSAEGTDYGLCLEDMTPDLKTLVLHCQPGGNAPQQVGLLDLASGSFTGMPVLPEQGAAGSAFISPAGDRLAYAVARRNPDSEAGRVVVASLKGEADPQAVQALDGGYFTLAGWLDAGTLLASAHQGELDAIWRVSADGSGAQQLATGRLIGITR